MRRSSKTPLSSLFEQIVLNDVSHQIGLRLEPHLFEQPHAIRAHGLRTEAPFADVVFYHGIGDLPHFNPDLDEQGAELPHSVKKFRAAIGAADAILISSPEYAHGIPGSLKNALDWLVSGPEMPGKPTGLLTASARSVYSHAALQETLRTMSTNLVPEAVAVVPLEGRRLDATSIAADSSLAGIIGTQSKLSRPRASSFPR